MNYLYLKLPILDNSNTLSESIKTKCCNLGIDSDIFQKIKKRILLNEVESYPSYSHHK